MQRRQFLQAALGIGVSVLSGCDSSADRSKNATTPTTEKTTSTPAKRTPIPADPSVDEVLGGKDALVIVRDADKVEAFRLKDSEYRKTIEEYETVGDAVPVDDVTAAKLTELFTNSGSFRLDSAKGCAPIYGVQVRFARKAATLDILFCFACDIFTTYVNGKSAGGEDFDPIRPELVRIMKSLFPKDDVIQKLTESGRPA